MQTFNPPHLVVSKQICWPILMLCIKLNSHFNFLSFATDTFVIVGECIWWSADEWESEEKEWMWIKRSSFFSRKRSIGVHCNDIPLRTILRSAVSQLWISLFFARTKPGKRYPLLTATKKPRTVRNDHWEGHTLRHFRCEKRVVKLQRVPSFFSRSNARDPSARKLDETRRRMRGKFTRVTVFRRDHGGGFSFEIRVKSSLWSLKIHGVVFLYLEIKSSKIRFLLQIRDLTYFVQDPGCCIELGVKSNWTANRRRDLRNMNATKLWR